MLRFVLPLAGVFAAFTALAAEPEVFTIKALTAQMRYDVSELTITPGADVKIIFENPDDMPHNMVFFQPGTDVVAVANKQMEKPEEALKREWLPEHPALWLHSKTVNPKGRDELSFKAPDKPGVYPFVCTFPGHAVTMQGRLKIFAPGPRLSGLKFQLYLGDWKTLPDFAKLQPHREGPVPDNLVQLKFDDYKNQFGVVYTGQLNPAKDGVYTFSAAGDDGVRIFIDGKKVVEHDGIHPASEIKEGQVKLTAGTHEFRMEYFQAAGEAEVYAAWRGPDFANTPLSTWVHPDSKAGATTKKKNTHTGMPLTVGAEPVIYRNFITAAGNRAIAVGYPASFNIAWSAETMNLSLFWRGAFMDAARHWIDRGGGNQPPLGYDVVRPDADGVPLATRASPDAEWPKIEKQRAVDGYVWNGYRLDAKRFPTFFYVWNGVTVADRFDVQGSATAPAGKLIRTIKLSGNIPPGTFFCAASGNITAAGPKQSFAIDAGKLSIEGRDFPNVFSVVAEGAQIAGKRLLIPARAEMQIQYSWPETHAHHAHHAH